jgi:two-component system phosphate regulon sensor histidine kinase PhoR
MELVDASKLLNSAIDRISVQADRAGITIKTKIPDMPMMIMADPPRMIQVIVNILHNAIKFTEKGGKIRASIVSSSESITIEIKDTGRGISREDLPRIFERFYKSKRPKQGSGTGLGLSIAKHLVEAHGGKIWVQSQLGQGTTFFISLPKHNRSQ